ncbi:MAG: Uma2 family endonuclease [Chloroflexi bacterium]|nr:Uma2 family endonuclease [Chloroflexota bacterium]MCY3581359.1 Uma2 family endonuclease [Chloroflexota bacterium]MCY3716396.1 Uma2 family endonuclease [Chloroflexota bacterium]MDE2649404.1 Uma2 family endonuclease [Chloroflexota bacterium]MYA92326.1 Uma2 family endonuclease [Chloroflexota bacterium]
MQAVASPRTFFLPIESFISADDFLKMSNSPEYADCNLELVEGVILPVSYTNRQHSEIMSLLAARLVTFVYGNNLGRVYSGDGGFVLERTSSGRDSVRGVDIAFIKSANAPDPNVPAVIEGAPDLAIEIISPSNTAADMQLKLFQLFAAGASLVWVVYPETRSVEVHTATSAKTLMASDTLEGDGVLPGFSVKVADIFPG